MTKIKTVEEVVEGLENGEALTTVAPSDWNDENTKGYLQAKEDIKPWLRATLTERDQAFKEEILREQRNFWHSHGAVQFEKKYITNPKE